MEMNNLYLRKSTSSWELTKTYPCVNFFLLRFLDFVLVRSPEIQTLYQNIKEGDWEKCRDKETIDAFRYYLRLVQHCLREPNNRNVRGN